MLARPIDDREQQIADLLGALVIVGGRIDAE